MTIASEITRLQNDKAAICTAIENKGVTVGSVTLDSYAACIDAIQTGGGGVCCFADVMVVGGGGSGGSGSNTCYAGGGGGAGGVIIRYKTLIPSTSTSITVGAGGTGVYSQTSTASCTKNGISGGDSSFGNLLCAYGGGGGGGGRCGCKGLNGGSGGGAGYECNNCHVAVGGDSRAYDYQIEGHSGGVTAKWQYCDCSVGGGGGGAGGMGCYNRGTCKGYGGMGISTDFGGTTMCYAGGGGGGSASTTALGGCGCYGGGDGRRLTGCSATTYGSGGGGSSSGCCCCKSGAGCQGIVIVRYPADGSYGINSATGGTVTTCTISGTSYKIHTFTSDGTFTIVS